MVDETKADDNPQTITTWDAPWGGTILVPSGIATRVLIPIPRTSSLKAQNGLVLSLLPPYYEDPKAVPLRKSTSTIFFRNPDDLTFGEPGLRLDFGKNKNTGGIDYHWNVEGRGAARQRFPNITNHMSAGKTGEIVHRAAKAFRMPISAPMFCPAMEQ